MTMPTKPNTRPCRSGSTVSCSSVIDGVEKNGTPRPTRNMKPKNTQTFGERPRPIESTPNTSDDTMIMRDAAALGEQRRDDDAAEHHADAERDLEHREVTTFCCSPASNERTSMSGVRLDGATVSTKMIANSTSSHRTNAWCAT